MKELVGKLRTNQVKTAVNKPETKFNAALLSSSARQNI